MLGAQQRDKLSLVPFVFTNQKTQPWFSVDFSAPSEGSCSKPAACRLASALALFNFQSHMIQPDSP